MLYSSSDEKNTLCHIRIWYKGCILVGTNFVTSSVCNAGKGQDLCDVFMIKHGATLAHCLILQHNILCIGKSHINNFKYNNINNHVYKTTHILTLSQV